MAQVGETVSPSTISGNEDSCPFDHEDKKHDKENKVGAGVNNATVLGSKMGSSHEDCYTAHHLIPGGASLPKTKLMRWIAKSKGLVKGDIGYDINNANNGIDLPGNKGIKQGEWASPSDSMRKTGRQFHDCHPAYSAFVVKALDAISEKLDRAEKAKSLGCGKKNCGDEDPRSLDVPSGGERRWYRHP